MNRRIHLHIDRLTLDGIDAGNRSAIAAAVERELVRRLGKPDATQAITSTTLDRIDGGRMSHGDIGTAIGARISEIVTRGGRS